MSVTYDNLRRRLCIAMMCFLAVHLHRAEAQVRWWWEGSIDNGQTWQSGSMDVSAQQQGVRVRARCQFPTELLGPAPLTYLQWTNLDAIVVGSSLVGEADSIDTILFADRIRFNAVTSTRFGNTLKIDAVGDSDAPGVGGGWIDIYQRPPNQLPNPNLDNPISPIEYTLRLDGSIGTRLVSGVFRDLPGQPPGTQVFITSMFGVGQGFSANAEQLSINVVPALGTLPVLFASSILVRRTSRRK